MTPLGLAPCAAAACMKSRFADTLLWNVNGFQPGICPSVASAVIDAVGVAKMTNTFAPLDAMWTTWLLITGPESVTLYD